MNQLIMFSPIIDLATAYLVFDLLLWLIIACCFVIIIYDAIISSRQDSQSDPE